MCITTHAIQKPELQLSNSNQPRSARSDVKPDFKAAADKLGLDPCSLVRPGRLAASLCHHLETIRINNGLLQILTHPTPAATLILLRSLSPSFTFSPTSIPP